MRALLAFVVAPVLVACAPLPTEEDATDDELNVAPRVATTLVDSVLEDGREFPEPVWSLDASARLWRAHRGGFGLVGRPVTRLPAGPAHAMTADGDRAVVLSMLGVKTGTRSVTQLDLERGTAKPVAEIAADGARGLATDQVDVYAVGGAKPGDSPTSLLRIRADGAVEAVSPGFGGGECWVQQLLLDEASVYGWRRCEGNGQIVMVPRTGGAPRVLVDSRVVTTLAQTATDLFYGTALELVRLPKSGGPPVTIHRGALTPGGTVAVSGTDAWLVDAMEVKRVPVAGGEATSFGRLPPGTAVRAIFPLRGAAGVILHLQRRGAAPNQPNHELVKITR